MRFGRVLVACAVLSLPMMLGSRPVRLGSLFVMFGGLGVALFRHDFLLRRCAPDPNEQG